MAMEIYPELLNPSVILRKKGVGTATCEKVEDLASSYEEITRIRMKLHQFG